MSSFVKSRILWVPMGIKGVKPHFDVNPSPGQLVPLEVERFDEAAAEKRAERRRDEIVWRRLQRADAALRVEEYFRDSTKPSLSDMLLKIDLPPAVVDKEFLRVCSGVAERLGQQRENAIKTLFSLDKEVKKRGYFQITNEAKAQSLYTDIVGKFPRGGMKIEYIKGFLLLSVENDDDYDDIYGEHGSSGRSGGRFHRAQPIKLSNREVSIVVRRGYITGELERDSVIVHEKQHWINQNLVKLDDAEQTRPSLFRLPANERLREHQRNERRRAIKDEVLAYIRDGSGRAVARTLDSDLYKHLFTGSSEEVAEEKAMLQDIAQEMREFYERNIYQHGLDLLVYALIDVPLRAIAQHIKAINGLYERNEGLLLEPQCLRHRDFYDIKYVPVRYQPYLDALRSEQRDIISYAKTLLQLERGFDVHAEQPNIIDTRRQYAEAVSDAEINIIELTPDHAWVPYVGPILGIHEASKAEIDIHEKRVRDVLDLLSRLNKASLDRICNGLSREESLSVVARNIQHVLTVDGVGGSVVVFRVAKEGLEVRVMYNTEVLPVSFTAYVSRLSGAADQFGVMVDVNFFHDKEEMIFDGDTADLDAVVPTRATAGAYEVVSEARREYELARANLSSSRLPGTDAIRNLDQARRHYRVAREALFRNGAHLPEIFYPDIPACKFGQEVSEEAELALDNLREALAVAAGKIPQDKIDGWVKSTDFDVRVREELRQAILRPIGETFGKGKIRNVGLKDVFRTDQFLTLVIDFNVESRLLDRLPARLVVRLYHRR